VVGLVQAFVAGEGLRSVLTVLAVVGGFWLMAMWLRRNRIALDLERGRRA
jgi:hypothetical protein